MSGGGIDSWTMGFQYTELVYGLNVSDCWLSNVLVGDPKPDRFEPRPNSVVVPGVMINY